MAANYYIPGHGFIISCILITAIILAYVSYILLTFPTYYYLSLYLSYYIYKEAFNNSKSKPSFPLKNTKTNVCIVGAGFSGLCMGIKLKKAGIPFRILEKSSQIGILVRFWSSESSLLRCVRISTSFSSSDKLSRFVAASLAFFDASSPTGSSAETLENLNPPWV